MPTTPYAITVTPPVRGGFYERVTLTFEHAASPAAAPNRNPAYLAVDPPSEAAAIDRASIADVTTFYFEAATAVIVRAAVGGDDDAGSAVVTPAALAAPAVFACSPSSSGAPSAELSSRYAPLSGMIPMAVRPDVKMHAHACASGHGWTDTGASAGDSVDLNYTGDYYLGTQCIDVTTDGAGTVSRIDRLGITSFSMTARQYVIWLKIVSGADNLSQLWFYAGDGGSGWTNYNIHVLSSSSNSAFQRLKEGEWVRLALPWVNGGSGGSPNRGAIQQFRLHVKDDATGAVRIRFGGAGSQPEPTAYANGVITFTFDDGYVSQLLAEQMLDQYGWAATAYPIIEQLNTSGGVTTADLIRMQDKGWDVGTHAYTGAMHNATGGATGVSQAVLEADLDAQIAWLQSNGFHAPEHWAYPQGYYNDTVLSVAKKRFTACCHTRGEGYESINPGEALRIGRVGLGLGVDLTFAQTRVTGVAAAKGWQVFMLHKLGATASDSITWASSDFLTLLGSIASAGCAVRTMSEMCNTIR